MEKKWQAMNASRDLIKGVFRLKAADGKKFRVVGETHQARFPISRLRPHAYSVTAVSDVTMIRFSQEMVQEITRLTATRGYRPGIEASEERQEPGPLRARAKITPQNSRLNLG